MMMTPERWKQIRTIFLAARDLAQEDERNAYLTAACAGDTELRDEIEQLLARGDGAETLLKETVLQTNGQQDFVASVPAIDPLLGTRLGAYRILSELGHGGMGAVYLAERADGAFNQRVAIKLVKRGMDTNFILRRFRQERQILATLNHPFIARLLDGGTTADDLPYFVMEYIEGQSLYQFSDAHRLSVSARLRLFRQVCEAVEYAHQTQVIHRDLKPSNVLVNAENVPKLLDFGIAKVLNPDLASDTIAPTATHMRLMTPDYASPEQIKGEAVTAASDIYSLGVLLYELLTGHRPYRFRHRAPHEVSRAVCEDEPETPSASITRQDNFVPVGGDEKPTTDSILVARNATLASLRNTLAGDLDRIILKALRKNPIERYASVAALAEDITNYLEKRPVQAESFAMPKPRARTAALPTPTTEKHSIAILPLHVIGASGAEDTGEMYLGIGLADALILRLSQVPRFIVRPTSSVLRYQNATVDPFHAGRELEVEFVVEGTIRRVGERIRVTVRLLNTKEQTTRWAEHFDENFTNVLELEDLISERVAHSLVPQLTGEEERQISKRGTNNTQAYEAYLRGRYFYNQFSDEGLQKAVAAFREASALDANYAMPHIGMADYYTWAAIFGALPSTEAFPLAKAEAHRALEIDDQLGEAYALLAFAALLFDWNWTESERLIKRALELSPNYSFAHECYSNWLASQRRFDEAIQEIRRAEELDPLSPRAMLMTAWTLYQARHYDAAVAKAQQANALRSDFPQGLLHIGNNLTHAGRAAEAIPVLRQSCRLWETSGLPQHLLVCALVKNGQRQEAEQVLAEMKARAAKQYLKPYFLAVACAALGHFDEAFAWFDKTIAEHSEWMIWLATDTNLDGLRQDPRYPALLRRTNNPLARPQNAGVSHTGGDKSLAVLPFKLLNPNADEASGDFMGVGLADALITRLSTVRRFIVRPTSSVLRFANSTDSLQAGRDLGVDFVLEGNIRRLPDRIRVTIQLLSVCENAARWAGSFDEKNADVLELEDSISARVANALIPHLTGEEQKQLARRGTNKPEAYEAYLRGRYHWNQFTPESLPKAHAAFENAIALDPEYALAYVGLADFYIWASIYGLMPSLPALEKAEQLARRAIALGEELGEAYSTLGLVLQNQKRWDESEALSKRAIQLSPNYVHAHEWYGAILVGTGRTEEGIAEIKLAERLDPLSPRTKTMVAWTLYQAHRFAEALDCAQQIVDLDKNYPQGHAQVGLSLLALGRTAEALPMLQKFDEMIPDSALAKYQLCFAYVAVGQIEAARTVFAQIKALAERGHVKPYFLAMAHVAFGEYDAAFPYFEQALAEKDAWMLWLGTEPMLANLHDDPRFVELLERMQNPLAEQYRKR
ncbi:MAG TPA: protein kinase [Blastocatellia bacterium]|nr:protein kinase [Blastocatellia bacterium]